MKHKTIFLFLFFTSELLLSTEVSVRILATKIVTNFIFSSSEGNYKLFADDSLIGTSSDSTVYQITQVDNLIELRTYKKIIGKFSKINLASTNSNSAFKIKCILSNVKLRTYEDNLEVTVTQDKSQLLIINKVDLEKYISGVVESEVGRKASSEYYKLQAILCRTYLLVHLNRHILEGFQVCDDVHCQAYLNAATDIRIEKAVIDAKGLVIVDNDLNLITAAFHSNCGGQTCNSEDVWSISTTYLKSRKDTFCLHQLHSNWQRTIPIEDWKEYLSLKRKTLTKDLSLPISKTEFDQNKSREIYFIEKDLKIPLKTIRADFKLKSTYFSIQEMDNSVLFSGRGYGHGVGVCQEGAMRMAFLKYTYKEILNFYYRDVHLVDLATLNYFKQE